MKFVLASKNKGKLKEISKLLSQHGIEVCLESDVGVDIDVDETGDTFEANSLLKAKAVMEATGLPSIADDSGLCINALHGEPGVYSARYGEGKLDDRGRCDFVLSKMNGSDDRASKFVCVITCCFPNGDIIQAHGECPGSIATEVRGSNGFAYDSIFIPFGSDNTFAEIGPDEKNRISHRRKALDSFSSKLQSYISHIGY